jgi:acetyl esterase
MLSGAAKLAAYAPPSDIESVSDQTIDGPLGQIPLRVYRPCGAGPFGGVAYFHGGGYTVGGIQTHDVVCRLLTERSGCVVMSVDYRLAPENPFPAGINDAYAALCWFHQQAAALEVDPTRIAVAGDSSGGNFAAVCTLLAREQKGPPLRFQVLIYPNVDQSGEYPPLEVYSEGYLLERELRDYFRLAYIPQGQDTRDFRVSPILAESLTGLPSSLVITAEYDPLRREGEAYARLLKEAGVQVQHHICQGMIHGFILYQGIVEGSGEALNLCAQALRKALG